MSSNKGDVIGKAIKKCCHKWVVNKIFTITVDNTSSIDMSYLKKKFAHMRTSIQRGKYMHIKCMTHRVNLTVTDGLQKLNDFVARARGVVKYVKLLLSRLAQI